MVRSIVMHCNNRWWSPFMLHLIFPRQIKSRMHNRNTLSHPLKCSPCEKRLAEFISLFFVLYFQFAELFIFRTAIFHCLHDSETEEDLTTSHDLHCFKLAITKPNIFKCVWVVKQRFIAIFGSHNFSAEEIIEADSRTIVCISEHQRNNIKNSLFNIVNRCDGFPLERCDEPMLCLSRSFMRVILVWCVIA